MALTFPRTGLSTRPWAIALLIGIVAEALFLWGMATPHQLVFDETHYVWATRTLLELSMPSNIEHPLLGKEIIAAGILLFGDNSFGWRFFSTLAGTGVVTGVFAIGWLIWERIRPALFAAILTLVNFTVFIQARIGMLDGFMAAFVVLAIASLLWAVRSSGRAAWLRLLLCAVLFGLAVATKWAAVPYVALAGIAIILLKRRNPRFFGGVSMLPALALLGTASIAVYFLTFWPAFYYQRDAMTLAGLLPFQWTMYQQQTLPMGPHTYQSRWWSWPLDLRPIWYLYENADGAQRGILMLGNPAIMWGGLVAALACGYAWLRDGATRPLAIATLWLASYAVWIIIPKKIGFFYYYYLPSILLTLVIAAAFDHFAKGRWRDADQYFAVLAIGLFVAFYPIISASALPNDQAFVRWMWMDSWR